MIDYGRFVDSESNYTFSAKDLIFTHNSSIKRGDFTHQSQSIKYIQVSIQIYYIILHRSTKTSLKVSMQIYHIP